MSVRAAVTSKIGLGVVALVLLGGGSAAAAVASAPEPQVADVAPAVPQEAPQPEPVAPVVEVPVTVAAPVAVPEPVAAPVEVPQEAPTPVTAPVTVVDVPKQQPAKDPSIGTTDAQGRYTPAAPAPKPGEPAVAPGGGMTPATPMLGDDPVIPTSKR